jgi:hypothetical protein
MESDFSHLRFLSLWKELTMSNKDFSDNESSYEDESSSEELDEDLVFPMEEREAPLKRSPQRTFSKVDSPVSPGLAFSPPASPVRRPSPPKKSLLLVDPSRPLLPSPPHKQHLDDALFSLTRNATVPQQEKIVS